MSERKRETLRLREEGSVSWYMKSSMQRHRDEKMECCVFDWIPEKQREGVIFSETGKIGWIPDVVENFES